MTKWRSDLSRAWKKRPPLSRDYLLTGFDNIPAAGFFDPPLTTITQSPGKLAENGIIVLDRLIDGHPVPDETFVPTELCVRKSCGCGLNPSM